jgi:modulator of FtsH protease HflK
MSGEVNIDLSEFGGPKLQIKGLRWIVAGIFGVLFLFTLFFSVATEEVGVIQRFGAYNRTVPPGLHIKLPSALKPSRKFPLSGSLKRSLDSEPRRPG